VSGVRCTLYPMNTFSAVPLTVLSQHWMGQLGKSLTTTRKGPQRTAESASQSHRIQCRPFTRRLNCAERSSQVSPPEPHESIRGSSKHHRTVSIFHIRSLLVTPFSLFDSTVAVVLLKMTYGDALSEEQRQALFVANKEALAVWFSAERPLLKLLLDLVPCCMSLNGRSTQASRLIFPSIQCATSRSGFQGPVSKKKPLESIN
jgi:hypothetical protein